MRHFFDPFGFSLVRKRDCRSMMEVVYSLLGNKGRGFFLFIYIYIDTYIYMFGSKEIIRFIEGWSIRESFFEKTLRLGPPYRRCSCL